MWAHLAVFVALFVMDFAYAKYTAAVTKNHQIGAGFYATAIIVLSGFGAIQYTQDPLLLIPAALGAFTGTVAAMRWGITPDVTPKGN